MATSAEQLAQVDAAIEALLNGGMQRYAVLGRTFERPQLAELWSMRKELVKAVAAESRGGARGRLARPV